MTARGFCLSLSLPLFLGLPLSFCLNFSSSLSVVSVELEVPTPVAEGADLTVCATLTFLGGTTALECDVTVNLETTDGTKAGGNDFV